MGKKGCLGAVIAFVGITILTVLILGGMFIGSYNKLQSMDENVNSKWAQVENQLKRRADLIPNLVETVKGYAGHEKEIFTSVAESRSKLSGAIKTGKVGEIAQANAAMGGALGRLMAIAENYPVLKADQIFMGLQDELAGTENRIAVSRMDYNNSVQLLNKTTRVFPTNIIAGFINIEKRDYFEVEESAKETPKVKF